MSIWPPHSDPHPDLTKDYYVIVGAGFSALVNHLTLRSSWPERLEELNVLHIGGPDPWQAYAPISMGQWPGSLTLPEAPIRKPPPEQFTFLPSDEFAAHCRRAWAMLTSRNTVFSLPGPMVNIGTINGQYQVRVAGSSVPVKARFVDVCAGPGTPARLRFAQLRSRTLWKEYKLGYRQPASRLLTGDDFLHSSISLSPGESVVVAGGGPTAAWCVERAQAAGCKVLWVAMDSLEGAFLSSERNDHLAQGPLVRIRGIGQHRLDPNCTLLPRHRTTEFAEGYSVDSVSLCQSGKLSVAFVRSNSTSPTRYVDYYGADRGTLVNVCCDRLVTAFGFITSANQRGSWAFRLNHLVRSARPTKHLIRDSDGIVLGMQSRDRRLRVLGASALVNPEVSQLWTCASAGAAPDPSFLYRQSLCEQSRVTAGIAIAAITIARANRSMMAGSCLNLNSMSQTDFDGVFAVPGASSIWADMRAERIQPFTEDESSGLRSASANY